VDTAKSRWGIPFDDNWCNMACHHHAEELRDADTTRHRQASLEVSTSQMSELQSVCLLRSWCLSLRLLRI
jgi:hypothetical protein